MASNSSQQFRERLPVMLFPSGSQMFRRAFGEARVVKNDLGSGALLHQFEFRNRIHAGVPTAGSPRLHNALTRDEFDMSPRDISAEESERASNFAADLRGLVAEILHRLHHSAEFYDFVEVCGLGERLIDARGARFDDRLLMNGFRGVGDFPFRLRPHPGWA